MTIVLLANQLTVYTVDSATAGNESDVVEAVGMIGLGPPPSVFVIIAAWYFPHRMPFKVAAKQSRLSAHDLHRVSIGSQGSTTLL